MQLEQQETFEIKGPQLEALGELEGKLPAPARRRPFAAAVLALAIAIAVFGIGGARLKGARSAVLAQFSATNEYSAGITSDLAAQKDAAASFLRIAGSALGTDTVQQAQAALDAWNATGSDALAGQYAAEHHLYTELDGLYNTYVREGALPADDAERLEELYATFVSAQATVDRAAAVYNGKARAFNETAAGFPANVLGALWGVDGAPLFAADGTGNGQSAAAYGEAHDEEQHDEAHHG